LLPAAHPLRHFAGEEIDELDEQDKDYDDFKKEAARHRI
jgi:hypothetical protein